MDQHKIDRLFREKLDQIEGTPSPKAWSQVEKQIRPKKTPIVYLVAASVSLLLISWIIWPEDSQANLTPIASEVNRPVNQRIPDFVIPEIDGAEDKQTEGMKPLQKTTQRPQVQTQFASNKSMDENPQIQKDLVPEIDNVSTEAVVAEVEMEEPVILDEVKEVIEKPAFKAVKITYIASNSNGKKTEGEAQKNDSTGVLKKFIAFTEKIAPGDMLADMKTAKDNLLNGGLKNKKERSSL
ncbi:MAG: hypothetical protein ABJG47_01860 [Ekhidna sp.]